MVPSVVRTRKRRPLRDPKMTEPSATAGELLISLSARNRHRTRASAGTGPWETPRLRGSPRNSRHPPSAVPGSAAFSGRVDAALWAGDRKGRGEDQTRPGAPESRARHHGFADPREDDERRGPTGSVRRRDDGPAARLEERPEPAAGRHDLREVDGTDVLRIQREAAFRAGQDVLVLQVAHELEAAGIAGGDDAADQVAVEERRDLRIGDHDLLRDLDLLVDDGRPLLAAGDQELVRARRGHGRGDLQLRREIVRVPGPRRELGGSRCGTRR